MKRFKNILCVVNSDAESKVALERAVSLAASNQARLKFVEIIDKSSLDLKLIDYIYSSKNIQEEIIALRQEQLEKLVAPLKKNIEITTKVLVGIPFLEIIHEVLRNDHDLVIKTAENEDILDRIFDSDDMHLLRKCPCPVWLVKPNSPNTYKQIVAAVDVDDFYPEEELNTRHLLNVQIIEMASLLALSEFSQLHVVDVWDAAGEMVINSVFHDTPIEKVDAYVEEVRRQNGDNLDALVYSVEKNIGEGVSDYLAPQIHLIKGNPSKEVPAFSNDINADLVVMGTVARTGIPGFIMGNTAETILNRLNCSVLAVKPQGFQTPIILPD